MKKINEGSISGVVWSEVREILVLRHLLILIESICHSLVSVVAIVIPIIVVEVSWLKLLIVVVVLITGAILITLINSILLLEAV